MLSAALMDSGMEFQMTGPATENALSPTKLSSCSWHSVVAAVTEA